jgi:hypothetical protein
MSKILNTQELLNLLDSLSLNSNYELAALNCANQAILCLNGNPEVSQVLATLSNTYASLLVAKATNEDVIE